MTSQQYFRYGPNSRSIRALLYTHTNKTTKSQCFPLLLWTEVQPVHTPVHTQAYGPPLSQSNFSILSYFVWYTIINGITKDSKTFYIRLYHGIPFKDQPYVKMPLTFNYTTRPSLTSFALPTDYLLATSLCSLLRHTPCTYFTFLVIGAHPLLDYRFALSAVPAPPKIRNRSNAINMHSRGPMEQYFCVLEPHRGCLDKVKKVCWYPLIKEGQQSHKYTFLRANRAIKMENVLVPHLLCYYAI